MQRVPAAAVRPVACCTHLTQLKDSNAADTCLLLQCLIVLQHNSRAGHRAKLPNLTCYMQAPGGISQNKIALAAFVAMTASPTHVLVV